jgi:hypothetical protein
MKNEDGIEALILAGTELPLLLRDSESPGIEFLHHRSKPAFWCGKAIGLAGP